MPEVNLGINPGKVLFGLSRIGYTPASAICDIIDNAVTANAQNINVIINRESDTYSDSRRGNVNSYLIVDNGNGMDEDALLNALQLGSSDEYYTSSTLSKFGLGLKSATFSQGDELQLISGSGGEFRKYVVSLPAVQDRGEYFANKVDIEPVDQEIIDKFLLDGHGTIVKIEKVRKAGHPSIRQTIEELKKRIGVIYYYFIKDNGLEIIIDNKVFSAIDVLFTEEAEQNGNLDEHEWNGREVKWIERPCELILDTESDVKAIIEVTQLPHPPTFLTVGERGGDKRIRDQYLIESSNYGFYVYRNKRLISWAQTFKGIIPQDPDLYSFRGRILIDDSADDAFNIDVKKSTLTLSDDAWNTISDITSNFKRKSIKAWTRAKQLKQERENKQPNQQANSIIEELDIPDYLPGQPLITKEVVEEVEAEIINTSRKRLERAKERVYADELDDSSEDASSNTEEVQKNIADKALKGDTNPYATKIFRVQYTDDNTLFEPYYDTSFGHCVRINQYHRFSRVIFEDNADNTDMQIMFELMLHQFSVSEIESLKALRSLYPNIDTNILEKILCEFRRITSEYLASMCRHLEGTLPPLSKY